MKMKELKQVAMVAVVSLAAIGAHALEYKGDISVGAGTLVVGGDWGAPPVAPTMLSWVVNDTDNAGYWTYKYTFDSPSPGISHGIVEVTDGATDNDFRVTGTTDLVEFGTWGSAPSNPGIPGSIFGIKVNTSDNTWEIITARAPVWQDFYAKGGGDSYAYNSGWAANDPIDPPADGSLLGHILGPNGTHQTPDGGLTLALLGMGLSGLWGVARSQRKS